MGRPGWDHRGLPCEPGRCLCQDIALLAQLPVLTPQTGQLLTLGAGRAVLSAAVIAIGLSHPVPDRLGGRFELARQLFRGSPRSDQINHLSPERRRIGSVTLRHRWHLLLKWKGVHRTGSIPVNAAEREQLAAIVADRNRPRKHVERARIGLASADRGSAQWVAQSIGVSRPTVWRWQQRFAETGVEGLLRDKTRKPGKAP